VSSTGKKSSTYPYPMGRIPELSSLKIVILNRREKTDVNDIDMVIS
jgi:hypothetical protein